MSGMDDMNVSNVESKSTSEGNGVDSDSSSQINGVEQNGSEGIQPFGDEMKGMAENMKSGDSLMSGNAAQDIIGKLMEQAKAMMSQSPEPSGAPTGAGEQSSAPTGAGEAAGGEASSIEDLLKKLIEQFTKQFNLNADQGNSLNKTADENSAPAPAETQSA